MTDASPADLIAVAEAVADALTNRRGDPIAALDEPGLRAVLDDIDFETPQRVGDAATVLLELLRANAVRSDHPLYLGLFNPPALIAGIAGDLVTAAINPQLAVWSHAPAAAEVEAKLVRLFSDLVWAGGEGAGTFTSGGSEANHTALLTALASRYPDWARSGVASLGKRPVLYASSESHLAWIKIARSCGLGADAVRLVPADDGLRLSGPALTRAIANDVAQDSGIDPVMVVATAGTTAHGAIDDIAGIAAAGRIWAAHVHVDAAWAGATLIDPVLRRHLEGIEAADSVTIDPHKWLAVPMAAGMFLSRRWEPLETAFAVTTSYMPSASRERRDPYIHSLQWSRRFIGGKLFVALAALGLPGYRAMMHRQAALGERLRSALARDGWRIENETPLPIVCFSPGDGPTDAPERIAAHLIRSGAGWLSTVSLRGKTVLRACITSFQTEEADILGLVEQLGRSRRQVAENADAADGQ